jgi:hypothetical protein
LRSVGFDIDGSDSSDTCLLGSGSPQASQSFRTIRRKFVPPSSVYLEGNVGNFVTVHVFDCLTLHTAPPGSITLHCDLNLKHF